MVSNDRMFFKPHLFQFCALVWLVLISSLATAGGETKQSEHPLESQFFSAFSGDLRQELKQAEAENKQLLLFFGTPVCPYCLQMRQVVLDDPEVQHFFKRHYRAIALNVNSTDPMRDEMGNSLSVRDFSEGLRIRVTPTLLFFDRKGESLFRQTGYIIRKQKFIDLGQSLLDEDASS